MHSGLKPKFNIKQKKICIVFFIVLTTAIKKEQMEQDPVLNSLIKKLKALNIETARTIQLIEQRERGLPSVTATRAPIIVAPSATTIVFGVGDRVTIVNTTKADRRATVTRVTENRVYYWTEGGQHSWRAPKNLRLGTENRYTNHVC